MGEGEIANNILYKLDINEINNMSEFLYGLDVVGGLAIVGMAALLTDNIFFKPNRIFKRVQNQYSEILATNESIPLDKAKELYITLNKMGVNTMNEERRQLIQNLEAIINPQIKKEMDGKEITPRTNLSEISPTYGEVSPYKQIRKF